MKLFGIEIRPRIIAFHWGYRSLAIGFYKNFRTAVYRYEPEHHRYIPKYFFGVMAAGILDGGLYSKSHRSNFGDTYPQTD